MTDKFYDLAEGIEVPAEYAEDLGRELDFAAAADVLATATAHNLDQAEAALAEAQARRDQAARSYEAAARAHELADERARKVMAAAGLVRTAAGIMPKAQAIAALPGLAIVPTDGAVL